MTSWPVGANSEGNMDDIRTTKPGPGLTIKALALAHLANVREAQRVSTEAYRRQCEAERAAVFADWAGYLGLVVPEGAHRFSAEGILYEVGDDRYHGSYPFNIVMPCPACGEARVRLHYTSKPTRTDYAFGDVLTKIGEAIEGQQQREAAFKEWSALPHDDFETWGGCDCKADY